jgi:hypothetical protein
MYKLLKYKDSYGITRLSDNASIPQADGNRDYQQFLQDVKKEGISIVEGSDVIEPDYVALRTGAEGYASTGEQLGMQFDGTWDAHIAEVKAKFPKTITGGTTIAPIPDWVEVEVEALRFREQLQAYNQATTRLEAYVLADGREEVREMQNTTEYVLDDEGMIVVDDEGNPTFMQEEVVVITAIEPLVATVEITEYSDIDDEPVIKTIENPEITQDNLERAEAQVIVDITPQPVIDAYDK